MKWLNEDVHQFLWEQTGRVQFFCLWYQDHCLAVLFPLKGRMDEHPTLSVPDAVQETHQREANPRAVSKVLFHPAGRTEVWAGTSPGAPFPSHWHTHMCMHTRRHTYRALRLPIFSGKNRDRYLVRQIVWQQQGGVQTMLRWHGWCLWCMFIRGDVMGNSSYQKSCIGRGCWKAL